MTPFAMRVARGLTADKQLATLAMQVLGATCFDITPVVELVVDAATELQKSHVMVAGDPRIDHGGLLFLPDKTVWIEWRWKAGRAGILLEQVEDQIGYIAFNPEGRPLMGFLELFEDGTFVPRHDLRQSGAFTDAESSAGLAGTVAAAALMLVNAPRGTRRETSPPHKGFRREMSKNHAGAELKPYHVIRLDRKAGHVGDGQGVGSPKAFHFCRAHVRRLAQGGFTKVRAHWRGNPALGICRADYEVAA